MSSAPGPLAIHEAICRQGSMTNIKICNLKNLQNQSQRVCMWMSAGDSFWNHSKPFQVGFPSSTATENRRRVLCLLYPQKTGEASNSFWQLLPVTARRGLFRNCTLNPSGTFEFYSTLSTPMSQPNTWLLFCRISWDSTLGMTSILFALTRSCAKLRI